MIKQPAKKAGSAGTRASARQTYRPDLDGLRAIAVVSVVIYHLKEAWLPGGFLGVDIFFVLSGYFITGIITTDALAGRFSYLSFYERRVRRIVPALLVMLTATLSCGYLFLLPVDYDNLAQSTIATLAFSANLYFWRDTNYFSRAAHDKPLLHMWSLGVEEQFYIFIPLLLVFLLYRLPKRALSVMAIIVATSFIVDIGLLRRGIIATEFYLLPSRAWELGSGSLLALSAVGGRVGGRWPRIAQIVSPIAFAALLLSLWLPWIGPAAALPAPTIAVLATAGLVWSGQAERTVAARILSHRAIIFIGLLSYSLYLWHWPIIVYFQYVRVRDPLPTEAIAALVVMMVAAWSSWRFVERPFRSRSMPRSRVFGLCATGAGFILLTSVGIIGASGIDGRFSAHANALASAANTHFRCPLAESLTVDGARACSMGLPGKDPQHADVALLGNSHALMYVPVVQQVLEEHNRSGIAIFAYSCPPLSGINYVGCRDGADTAVKAAAKSAAATVVIATSWRFQPYFVTNDGTPVTTTPVQSLTDGLDGTIDILLRARKHVVLVGPLLEPLWDVPSIASRQIAFGLPQRPLFDDRAKFDTLFSNAIRHFSERRDIDFVRVDGVQCSAVRCDYARGDLSLFADLTHVSRQALPLFKPVFERALEPAVSEKKRR